MDTFGARAIVGTEFLIYLDKLHLICLNNVCMYDQRIYRCVYHHLGLYTIQLVAALVLHIIGFNAQLGDIRSQICAISV